MAQRIAAATSLLVFTVCLVIGTYQADNTFITTVIRALVAMVGTFVIGLIIGTMAQKMLDENFRTAAKKMENSERNLTTNDR